VLAPVLLFNGLGRLGVFFPSHGTAKKLRLKGKAITFLPSVFSTTPLLPRSWELFGGWSRNSDLLTSSQVPYLSILQKGKLR
jgi:hypothetical protein